MDKETITVFDLILKYGSLPITIIVGVWAWYKFNKQQEINKNIELLKSQLAQNQTVLNSAISSFSVERQASQERRVAAVESIWNAVIEIRQQLSPVAFFYDILVPSEYNTEVKNHPMFNLGGIEEKIPKLDKANLETCRPFVGEKL